MQKRCVKHGIKTNVKLSCPFTAGLAKACNALLTNWQRSTKTRFVLTTSGFNHRLLPELNLHRCMNEVCFMLSDFSFGLWQPASCMACHACVQASLQIVSTSHCISKSFHLHHTICFSPVPLTKPTKSLSLLLPLYMQTVWVKLFGNANEKTKSLFQNRLKIKSTPCFVVFKDGEVGIKGWIFMLKTFLGGRS